MSRSLVVLAAAAVMTTVTPGPLLAQEAGHIKVSRGVVQVERAGQKTPAAVGAVVQAGDVVSTGADGSVGITFLDNSLLSAGPNSVLAIDRFGNDTEILTKGRHDPCVGIRAVPVGEAMMALVLADHFLRHRAQMGN